MDDVYLVLTNQLDQPPQPKLTCTDVEQPDVNDKAGDDRPVYFGYWASRVTQTCQYETREEYAARLHAERDTLFAESLPDYSMLDAAGVTVESGVLHSAAMLARPLFAGAEKLVSIVSLDVVAAEPAIADTEGVFTGGASIIYGGLDNLYVFDQGWNSDDGTTTKILQFAWGDAADTNLTHERGPVADTSPTRARGTAAENPGDIQIVATGEVPGRMLNQFSADEFGGYLRLATTVDGRWWDFASGREHNDVFVLQADHGVLETVGLVQDIAPGETIRSTRFVGDRAFMTTFRDIDPLFALDTSDPADPRVVGSLHVPGFSSYMQPIDANHLLTVGQNTPNGWAGAPQVSLFDIRDLTRPVLIDNYTFERFSTTEAASDHHAFGWFAEHGVLAVPSGRSYWARVDTDGDGFRETRRWVNEDELLVFRIDVTPTAFSDHGIQLLGTVEQQSRVRRGAYIGDVLYSVATQSIKAVDINQPDRVIAEIVIGGSDPNVPPSVVTRIAAFLAAVDESPIGPARDPGDSGGNPVNEPVNKPPNDPVNDPPTDPVKDPPSDGGAATVEGLLADLPGASVSLVADPAAPDDTMLVIVGTDQNDRIVIRPAHRGSEITVRVNRERFGPFDVAVVDRVLLDGRGGNDSIRASKRFHTPVRVYDAAIADFTAFESPRGNAPVPVLDRSRDRALDATSLAHLMRWRFRHRTVLDDDGRS